MTRRWMHRTAALSMAAAWLLAAGVAIAADAGVEMRDFSYAARTVTIREGDTVTWTNTGEAPHDAAGDGWSTELLASGQRDSVRFNRAGRYAYTCTIHPQMTGTVVVKERVGGGGNAPVPTQPPTDTVAGIDGDGGSTPPFAVLVLGLAAVGGLLVAGHRLARARAR